MVAACASSSFSRRASAALRGAFGPVGFVTRWRSERLWKEKKGRKKGGKEGGKD